MPRLRENQVFSNDRGEILRIEQLLPHTEEVVLKSAGGFTKVEAVKAFSLRLLMGEYRPHDPVGHAVSIGVPHQVSLTQRQQQELKRRKQLMDLCRQVKKQGMTWQETIAAATVILNAREKRQAAQDAPAKDGAKEQVVKPLALPCKRTLQRWERKTRAASSDIGLAPGKGGWRRGRARRPDQISIVFGQIVAELEANGELQNFKTFADLLNRRLRTGHGTAKGLAPRTTPKGVAQMLKRELPWSPRLYKWFDSRTYRALTREAKELHDAQRPLELLEVDALIPDFHVCDADGVILGAPTIYACIDVATGIITGIEAYLQSPGTEPLMDFCSQAFFPKPPLEDGTELPWGVPESVLSDQGPEFRSDFWANLMLVLGASAIYAEGEAGWRKPHIERFFKTIQESLIWRLSGSTRSEARKTTDPNLPLRTGSMTLSEFRTMIRKFAYEIYPNIVSERLSMKFREPAMTPRKAWHKLIRDFPPTVPITREAFLGTTAQYLGDVTLSHKGVVYRHIWYSSDALFELRRQFGDTKVVLYGSPIDVGVAHVKHVASGRTAQVWAKDASVHGMTRVTWDRLRDHLDIGKKKPGAEETSHSIAEMIEQSQKSAAKRKTGARKKGVQAGASAVLGENLREQRDAAGAMTPPAANDAYTRPPPLAANAPTVPFTPSVSPTPFTGNGTAKQAGTTKIVRLSDLDGEQS